MKVNGVVKLKHTLMYIDEKTIVHWTTSHLTFIDMVNVPKFMNSEHLDMTSTQSIHHLKIHTTGQNKDNLCFILTAELQ